VKKSEKVQTLLGLIYRALKGPWTRPYQSSRVIGDAEFDAKGNLVSYTDEAADTWLFCLATGKSEPVEMAEMVEEGYSTDQPLQP